MGRRNVWAGVLLTAAGALGGALAGPPAVIPPADAPPATAVPEVVTKVEDGAAPLNGPELLPRAVAAARDAYSRTRDYAGHLVRQERVNGVLLPEQAAEVRCRVRPFAINVRVVKPDSLRGEETSYFPVRVRSTVRFKPAGVEGVRGFQTHTLDSPKVLAHTRHPATEVGLLAVLDRVEKVLATEARLGRPAGVAAAQYVFAGRPITRFEVHAAVPHPARYAAKCVVCFDKATKLPVRFEAYDAPKAVGAPGELIEAHSYVGLVFNTGLGDPAFER